MIENKKQAIFIAGAKNIGRYGGYESFLKNLLEYHKNRDDIQYYIACKANGDGKMNPAKLHGASNICKDFFIYCNAKCFLIKIPEWLKSAQAIYYDLKALSLFCKIIEEKEIENPIVYILACRIGPFMKKYVKKIHSFGGKVYVNPDGHEFKRAKWSAPVKKYWKESEYLMVKYADLLICDSINIEKYIHNSYNGKCVNGRNPKTIFIAYGAECRKSQLSDNNKEFVEWLQKNELKKGEYYLSVGRFVPENNFETMIQEFMKSGSKKKFAIITTTNDKLLKNLENKLHFQSDKRIRFVGTVYNPELLMKIRENAYAYFHGHEVGGTNPSLLEALSSTKLNLIYNVNFNKEVAGSAALYWNKERGNLAELIEQADRLTVEEIDCFGKKAKKRISDVYSWQCITDQYLNIFCNNEGL